LEELRGRRQGLHTSLEQLGVGDEVDGLLAELGPQRRGTDLDPLAVAVEVLTAPLGELLGLAGARVLDLELLDPVREQQLLELRVALYVDLLAAVLELVERRLGDVDI